MDFYNYLVNQYGYNEAILLNEIAFKDYSLPWIKKAVSRLCSEGKMVRFEKGVYYIPTETFLGVSKLDPRKILTKKYIKKDNEIIGYYSGSTFMNMIGLSTQVPNTIEIYTNNEKAKVREISVGSQKVVLRRSRLNVNKRNAATMSLLELMNFTDASFYNDESRSILSNYIVENNITKKDITECSPAFPDKAMRTLVESEVIYSVR